MSRTSPSTARSTKREQAFARLDAVWVAGLSIERLAALAQTSHSTVKAWMQVHDPLPPTVRQPRVRNRKLDQPEIGLGATVQRWTDRHAGTIVEVGDDFFVWQRDRVTRVSDHPPTYRYAPDPDGAKILFKRALSGPHVGQWTEAQRWRHGKGICTMSRGRADGMTVMIGVRDEYLDPSFSTVVTTPGQ
jgi:hypothetical protein